MQSIESLSDFREVIIELSYNCNLSCTICGFGRDYNPIHPSKFMSFEAYKSILSHDWFRTKSVRLNGRGESLIHPEFLNILQYTRAKYPLTQINIFTNLSFRDSRIIDDLIKYNVQLYISLDSSEHEELSIIRKFINPNSVFQNIDRLRNAKLRPFIVFTIQPLNLHRISDMAYFAFENQCNIIYNTYRSDEDCSNFSEKIERHRKSIIEQFEFGKRLYAGTDLAFIFPNNIHGIELQINGAVKTNGELKSCQALKEELCILYDGTVIPCNMFNPYIYGNVFQEDLNSIWCNYNRISFLNEHKRNNYCKNCAYLGGV